MSKNSQQQQERARNWLFIVYPESAPEDWIERLDELNVQTCISPLHDKDVNPTGELKKAHYHVLLAFDGNKSFNQVSKITDELNASIPIIAQSVKGSVRYFTHMDNPEKYQYNSKDIVSLSGFDVAEALKPSSADRYSLIKDMIEFIQDNQICEFEELIIYAMNNKADTWFPLLCDNSAYIISKVIDSKRNRYKDGFVLSGKQLIDVETGEVCSDKSHLFKEEATEDQ